MKIIKQIGIIFAVCWLSLVIEKILPFAFPASVIGMALLLVCLITGLLKIEHIQEKADFLLENMAFFFIPAGVGIMEHAQALLPFLLPLLLICLITTILTFAASGLTVRLVIYLQEKHSQSKKEEV